MKAQDVMDVLTVKPETKTDLITVLSEHDISALRKALIALAQDVRGISGVADEMIAAY
jgi:hypothetical protein